MATIHTVGLDIARRTYQLHAVDIAGTVTVRQKLSRKQLHTFLAKTPPCLIGMEGTAGANHLGRELVALGHTVRLMPSSYVKPY